jgi:protein-tyrosine-phosphatase
LCASEIPAGELVINLQFKSAKILIIYINSSPMAQAIFADLVRKRNLQSHFLIDSAAISECMLMA